MSSTSPQDRISLLIKAKRRETGLGVRAAADVAGISAATMSRLERGLSATLPDVGTLTKLASWLEVSVGEMLEDSVAQRGILPTASTPEFVEVHLRADKNLTPAAAKALAETFKAIYEQVSKHGLPQAR